MKEILFRGKRIDNGEWETGFLVIERYQTSEEKFYITDKMTGYHTPILPKTVGQYTGLTDKNRKMIFEGDIINAITLDTGNEQKAVVGFGLFIDENNDEEYIGFYIEFDGIKTTITQLSMEEVKDRIEVIGNIHDNPELLEVEE